MTMSALEKLKSRSKVTVESLVPPRQSNDHDPRLFRPVLSDKGVNNLVVRLLPPNLDDAAFIPMRTFRNPQTRDVFREPYLDGEDKDLIQQEASKAYKSGNVELFKKIVGDEGYLVNVLVLKDAVTPENVGKVFILRFKRQLHKQIIGALNGDEGEPINPFNILPEDEQYNLHWRITKGKDDAFPKYTFSFVEDNALFSKYDPETVYEQCHHLADYRNTAFKAGTVEQQRNFLAVYMDAEKVETNPSAIYGSKPSVSTPDVDDLNIDNL